jgi:general stress protein CsbA
MALIEREATNRYRRVTRAQWMGFILTFGLGAGGIYLGATGHDWLAAAIVTTTIGIVTAAFLLGQRQKGGLRPRK